MAVGFGELGEGGDEDVFAQEFDGVAELDLGQVGDVDHHLIHADKANNAGASSVDVDLAFVAEGPGVAVAVTNAECGDSASGFCYPGSVVRDGFTFFDKADGSDSSEPPHHGDEVVVIEPVGVDAVGVHADADEVLARVGVEGGGGGIGRVDEGFGGEVEGLDRLVEEAELSLGSVGIAGGVEEVLSDAT